MREFQIGDKTIGPGHGVYFIAEAGSNHDRKLDQARRLIDVAAEAGADAVKFQTFRADALYPRSAGMTDYLKVPRSIYDIIRDLEMPLEWLPELAEHCARAGLHFLSTPFDERSADALAPYVPAFKIASYEMTHHGLAQHCARKGKPLICSTGTAALAEVAELVEAVRAVGCDRLVLLQCTAKYPAPLGALNVNALTTMAQAFGVPVGLSDHSREPLPGPMAATALGASVIEKHFTLSNDLPGPDHAYALEPKELAEVIRMVRAVERTLGSGEKEPQPEEAELRRFARRSVFTTRAMGAGEPLTAAGSAVLRCGNLPQGAHPREWVRLLGRRARRDLAEEAAVTSADFEPLVLGAGEVTLRPLAAGDADRVVAWRARPEVADQLFSDAPTREAHDRWFAQLERRTDRLELAILERERPVGTIGLSNLDFGALTGEYGILVGEPDARGRGVARAASRALLDWAFGALGLERVRLELFADNPPARRLYDGLGFTLESELAPRLKRGVPRPVIAMSLSRDAWRKQG
jgi:N-acetylneuraminate synthase